jgi:hypothetical protein
MAPPNSEKMMPRTCYLNVFKNTANNTDKKYQFGRYIGIIGGYHIYIYICIQRVHSISKYSNPKKYRKVGTESNSPDLHFYPLVGYYIYFLGEGNDSKVALFALSIARLVRADLTIKVYTNAHASTHVLWWTYILMHIYIWTYVYIYTYKYDVYLHMRICVHMPHGFRYNIVQRHNYHLLEVPTTGCRTLITLSLFLICNDMISYDRIFQWCTHQKNRYTHIHIYIHIYKHIHMYIYIYVCAIRYFPCFQMYPFILSKKNPFRSPRRTPLGWMHHPTEEFFGLRDGM